MLGAIMSILDTTVVNVAIDRLAVDFHSSLTTIQWVVTGYTLSLATVIPISGWASDRFGTKRIYLTSLVLFTLGSVLSGLAWSAASLIGFRILQGLGGGMIMPSVMTIITQKAGPQRMGRVMGDPRRADADRADHRADPRRLAGRQRLLALDLLHQPADRDPRLHPGADGARSRPARRPPRSSTGSGMLLLSPGLALLIYGLAESSPYGFGDARSLGPTARRRAADRRLLRRTAWREQVRR